MKAVERNDVVSPERSSKKVMNITKDQAKYWYRVAIKDLADGNRQGAWNIYKWLKENNAWYHAKYLYKALENSS